MLFKEWEEELAQVLLYCSMDLSEQEKGSYLTYIW